MITLVEETDDNTHGGDRCQRSWRRQMIPLMEETYDNTRGGDM